MNSLFLRTDLQYNSQGQIDHPIIYSHVSERIGQQFFKLSTDSFLYTSLATLSSVGLVAQHSNIRHLVLCLTRNALGRNGSLSRSLSLSLRRL